MASRYQRRQRRSSKLSEQPSPDSAPLHPGYSTTALLVQSRSLSKTPGNIRRGQHAKYLSRPFTEQSVAMLSGVLHSPRAVQVNIAIMRTFVKLRELLATHKDLAQKLEALEKKYDRQFKVVFDAIRQLMKPEDPPKQQRIRF
jgi:hypothetical protein